MFAGKKLVDLTPEDFAKHEQELLALGKQALQEQRHQDGHEAAAMASHGTSQRGLTNEELKQYLAGVERADGKGPLTAEEYRQQQAQGGLSQRGENRAPTYEEFLAMYYPHLLRQEQERKQASLAQATADALQGKDTKAQLGVDATQQDAVRCQMPAVEDPGSDGQLVKTIEHYAFADGEESVQFYVLFDKDLWNGAAEHIAEAQIQAAGAPST
mmetsp:Transcript_41511/g.75216  ORF Transcript_41511/g.75216 Transcript_41511/m.75216 type:complete len:214 (+) Transcript_41511:108-749(+)